MEINNLPQLTSDFFSLLESHIEDFLTTSDVEALMSKDPASLTHQERLQTLYASPVVQAPMVGAERKIIKWLKMIGLYLVWYFVAFKCADAAWYTLFFDNDGGAFSNECYYMFFNGVKFYVPPSPYDQIRYYTKNGDSLKFWFGAAASGIP